jgi:hypothetical protein
MPLSETTAFSICTTAMVLFTTTPYLALPEMWASVMRIWAVSDS